MSDTKNACPIYFIEPPKVNSNSVFDDRLTKALTGLLFCITTVLLVRPLFSGLPWMVFMQDDFFYYLKVAQNLSHGKGSTFNGLVLTNGYHPLWLLILTAVTYFSSAPKAILASMAVCNLLASAATFSISFKLVRTTGVRQLTAMAIAVGITIYSLRLFYYCMEVTLAIPMILAMIYLAQKTDYWLLGMRQSFYLGLLFSAAILSRLDSAILVWLILVLSALNQNMRKVLKSRHLIGIAFGFLPLVIYFSINYFVFHSLLPISGMAKQLTTSHIPHGSVWKGLYLSKPAFLAVILPIPVALLVFPSIKEKLPPSQRVLLLAVLLYPWIYYLILSCLSDWDIWGWYMYPFRPAMCGAMMIFCTLRQSRYLLENRIIATTLLVILFGYLLTSQWRVQETQIYDAAIDLQEFSRNHPGNYAMGDRSGRFGFLLSDPMVQTEGLVMDRTYLNMIKSELPLREVLKYYNVRFYVGSSPQTYTGCFEAVEPRLAGKDSPHLRGKFCQKPLLTIIHDGWRNDVFDLQPEKSELETTLSTEH